MTVLEYMRPLYIDSDIFTTSALFFGISISGLTFILVIYVIILSFIKEFKDRRLKRLISKWRPMLALVIECTPGGKTRIRKRDALAFIFLWNHYHQILKGDAKEKLNKLFLCLDMNRVALGMLRKKDLKTRLVSVMAVGNLKDFAAWEHLERIAYDKNSHLSMAAAQSMAQISPKRAVAVIMDLLKKRTDWSQPMAAVLLKEAGSTLIASHLVKAISEANPAIQPRLIRYLDIVSHEASAPIIRQLMLTSDDDEVITACLHRAKDPLLLDRIRELTGHETWFVRTVAATALGRIGGEDDIPRLMGMLSDKVWWVRYRAACAIANLPFITLNQVKKIRISVNDPFGKEMLAQVIAEKEAIKWNWS